MKWTLRLVIAAFPYAVLAQTNQWKTQYVTFDDAVNGTGHRTASVAVVGPNAFVAMISDPASRANLFGVYNNNYLVGYVDADSAVGRVADQPYDPSGQFETWSSGLDQVTLNAAWQIAGGKNNRVYVANNDPNHNILVFELTPLGVISTDFRMETGSENIFAIEVDTAGYVYVVDYQGTDAKTNEVKIFAPIGAPNTTWDVVGGHNDSPLATIDLSPGVYQGVTVSSDGQQIFISATTQRRVWKFTGDPVKGYTQDTNFSFTLSPDDIIGNGGFGTPRPLGLAYLDDPGLVFAVADSFIHSANSGGYPYGRIYVIHGSSGASVDTIDIAEWNLQQTGAYNARPSDNGRAGGYTSVCDVDVSEEPAVYTQTFFGWAVEKWIFDGDLGNLVSVEKRPDLVPNDFALAQNYPNPFNPTTTIEFSLQTTEHVTLSIFNLFGQKVATLVDERLTPGAYQVDFDARKLSSGIYFYTLQAGKLKTTKKMALAK